MPNTDNNGWRGWYWGICAVSVLVTMWCVSPVEARRPRPAYTLLHAVCDTSLDVVDTLWHLQDHAEPILCVGSSASVAAASPVAASQESGADQMPALQWKTVQEIEKLHPIARASTGLAFFGTFDGDVGTLNLPLLGTTLLSSRTGFVDFGAMVGVGLGGVYVHLGVEFPLYYKYGKVWSLDFILGTAYNLGFFLEPTWKSTGFWGGGPIVNLELGVLRISTVFAVGIAGAYCVQSFLCDAGPGAYIALGAALIESTTGLPSQRQ
jgi:hypothetical protein